MSQLWTLIYYAGHLTIAVNGLYIPSLRLYSITSIRTQHPENRHSESNDERTLSVRIPNREIRSVYDGWLRSHLRESIRAPDLDIPSKALFEAMIQGDFSKFAHGLRVLSHKVTYRIFGSKEAVYQGFMYAFFLATSPNNRWVIHVEPDGGVGRLDLEVWHPDDHRAVIHEYKNNKWVTADKKASHPSNVQLLTKSSEEALNQIQTKQYRNILNDKPIVTELHEYGIAFMGTCCAVVGRTLSRKGPGDMWKIEKSYNGDKDEASRAQMYSPPVEHLDGGSN
jgi:hypothetical protein